MLNCKGAWVDQNGTKNTGFLVFSPGDLYAGGFEKEKKHGEGILTTAAGEKWHEEWNTGKLVKRWKL